MEDKHNSGPWKITHTALNGYRVSDSTGWGVAIVLKDPNDKANARLIAAAPDMRTALREVISMLPALREVESVKTVLEVIK